QRILEQEAGDGADLFQRSSSAVEGRNGYLSLYRKRPENYIYPPDCTLGMMCPGFTHRGTEHGTETAQSRAMASAHQRLARQWSHGRAVL
ncbi:MAG: hypothetical protein EOM91_21970, partial [Sphingobacteriia bacterium]|nr:hypothetical protein [Sphingobacteriia bacterium]